MVSRESFQAQAQAQAGLLPDALAERERIAARLDGRRLAVFLDYDGVLSPIVADPAAARMSQATRAALVELARRCPVAVISGRDRHDVQSLVALDDLVYAGSHGFDIEGPGIAHVHPDAHAIASALDAAQPRLHAQLDAIRGVFVERKRFAIAVHWRNTDPARVTDVERVVTETVAAIPALRKTGGKMIFELRPRLDWDKGRALEWLLAALHLDGPEVLPLYIGDDETDEDAFAVLAERGIGVLVADEPQPSRARYRLHDPDAVAVFLRHLIETLPM